MALAVSCWTALELGSGLELAGLAKSQDPSAQLQSMFPTSLLLRAAKNDAHFGTFGPY